MSLKKDSSGKIILGGGTTLSRGLKSADPLALGKTLTTEQMKGLWKTLQDEFKKRDPRYGRFIIIGFGKSGKTTSLRTLPKPILLCAFDPDCEVAFSDLIEKGDVLPVRYYGDDPDDPTVFRRWETDYRTWKANGFLDCFGSYVIDSFSTWSIAALREIARMDMLTKKAAIERGSKRVKERVSLLPQLNDYNVLKLDGISTFLSLCSLPCHLVLTAHFMEQQVFANEEDKVGYLKKSMSTNPAMRAAIPPLFSEVYLATTKGIGRERRYVWLTTKQPGLGDLIGSRLAMLTNIVAEEEPQNFRALLKKCNFHHEDKPSLA